MGTSKLTTPDDCIVCAMLASDASTRAQAVLYAYEIGAHGYGIRLCVEHETQRSFASDTVERQHLEHIAQGGHRTGAAS